MRDQQLADLLRTRRDRLRPGDVGLPEGTRRRARGLRREEVAGLAGISTTYYTFLEQGRDVRPSRQVLDALARALRMDAAERAHLHQLVHGEAAPAPAAETLDPQVTALVDRLDPSPAYVTGRTWDVLAANRAARLLWTDWPSLPTPDRNMLWWTFTDPTARTVLVEWETEAAVLLGRFRAASARHPGDPAFTALLERLRAASPQARAWWARHDVTALSSGVKRLRHPLLGELSLRHLVLQVADDPEQKLVTFTADEADQERLAALLRADRHA
jgi:transcriptional regulator with XRE-family HTH domain